MTRMQYERISRCHLDKYKARNKRYYINKASAELWAEGVPWDKARSIVTEAFRGATFQERLGDAAP